MPFELEDGSHLRGINTQWIEQLEKKPKLLSQYQFLIVSGWAYKRLNKLCYAARKFNIPVIMLSDTAWCGSWRQRMAILFWPIVLKPCFSHAWVAGIRQYEFVRRLGFPVDRIKQDLVLADTNLSTLHSRRRRNLGPIRRFLYIGRLMEHKGVLDLINAFQNLITDNPALSDLHLTICGLGPLSDQIPEEPQIELRGFVSPDQLDKLFSEHDCSVVPSRYEPWGVVTHEAAFFGIPLIVSDMVNSREKFAIAGDNAVEFVSGNVMSLTNALKQMIDLPVEEVEVMRKRSLELGTSINQRTWTATLEYLLNH